MEEAGESSMSNIDLTKSENSLKRPLEIFIQGMNSGNTGYQIGSSIVGLSGKTNERSSPNNPNTKSTADVSNNTQVLQNRKFTFSPMINIHNPHHNMY
eukprot:CAMPEP_0202972170 /NCGR_PEP_ID=MMETSP1396-20130829/33916_1 /ASSEMBLY_ACC=CAM_ASM_000872 /TAXON_ID= /ORGANISM="Pseudokeronopsis sp., Strain Brazil" /LENGTH=97 /DNA_ID=CAMNT_0049702279 /DNA_START=251 /DNA_END=544 /DNA_ORIENTATION=-